MKSKLFVRSEEIEWEKVATGVRRQILGYESELMMVHVVFEKGAVGVLHSHLHRQVSYIEAGSFEINISGEKKILNKGDSFSVMSPLSCQGYGILTIHS
jgi:quercetin dioxygenase-like cupin family protein